MTDQAETNTPPQGTAAPSPEDALARMRERLIQSELRAAAREAGMHDLDGLRLLEQSGLVLDDKMELPEAGTLIARLKRDKPYLFAARNSGPVGSPPPVSPMKMRNAMEMTLDEWSAARAELLRRR